MRDGKAPRGGVCAALAGPGEADRRTGVPSLRGSGRSLIRVVAVSCPGNRAWTRAKAGAEGCAESVAILTLRAETITRAPILSSFRRSVPAVARARPVPASARRSAAIRMEAKAEKRSRSWSADRGEAEVQSANRSCCCLTAFSPLRWGQ